MLKPRGRRKRKRRFEAARAIVLGQARVKPGRRGAARSRIGWRRGLLLFLVAVVAGGALWLTLDDRFYIYRTDVDVVGAVRVSPDEIFRASGLSGLHVLWARSASVEERLLAALPNLESAEVACKPLPAQCTIAVTEWRPRMMWDEDGVLWWIGAAGTLFSAESPTDGEAVGGLTVRGPLPRDESGRLDERVYVALDELWKSGADVPQTLYYVPERGLMFTTDQGWRVILGQGPGMNRRLRVLELLTSDLQERGLAPRFVDVRFADAPYYSLTNEW